MGKIRHIAITAEDPFAGLADRDRLARDVDDLDLYHPWALTVERAIEMGRAAESAALAVDKRIVNSEGATVSRGESEFVYANSNGFAGGYRSSRHHIDCAVVGDDGRIRITFRVGFGRSDHEQHDRKRTSESPHRLRG